MEFCPKCGKMLLPQNGIVNCDCGYSKELSDDKKELKIAGTKFDHDDNVKYVEDIDLGEGINEICPKCGHDKATYELKQTRSADEAPTRFFTCKKCKHKWREYD